MPASADIPASVSITLNMGCVTLPVGTYPLGVTDAIAKAQVLEKLIRELVRQVLADWPKVIYSEQIQNLVRQTCKNLKAE